jgi:hypothetical protein
MYPSTYLIATFPYKTIYYFETANNDLVFVKHHVYSASFAVHFKLRPTLYSRAYQVNYSITLNTLTVCSSYIMMNGY